MPGGWDADKDGVLEGVQHNTYDVEFYGPNPMCGIFYLGALRAGEEMARAAGDAASAAEYRALFERGSKWIDANLFNGEFYMQKIRGVTKDKIAPNLLSNMGIDQHGDARVPGGRRLPARSDDRAVPGGGGGAGSAGLARRTSARRWIRSGATTTSARSRATIACSARTC